MRSPCCIGLQQRWQGRGLDIRSAKVATLGHEVVDVFYVQQPGTNGTSGQVDASEHDALRHDLKLALVER